VCDAQPRPHM